MAREFSRANRFGEVVMRELALMLQREVSDPRIGMVTVSHVDVTADLKYAKVFVTRFNGFESEQDIKECLQGLNSASGYLRRGLAGRVKLRNMPELKFVYDESLEHGFHMDELIARANKSPEDDES
ncbi:MAG TPA: 30S ribosome-binding factor RbfA [Methylophaga aminisulfidivorans]|uniref:Ribosome-binding factor A n=2 Tax=root TaxID=1 RepID=A0A7C2AMN5_9GAMM|nr:30S ribosome-binding factor RbfA [Methylophaga aminisulfidivorans]